MINIGRRKHILDTSRPEFIKGLMGGRIDDLDGDVARHVLYDTSTISYVVYTVLMEADIKRKDILEMHVDEDSVAITFRKKSIAEDVRDACNKETVIYGDVEYRVRLKVKGNHLIAEVEQTKTKNDEGGY